MKCTSCGKVIAIAKKNIGLVRRTHDAEGHTVVESLCKDCNRNNREG